MLQFRVQVYGNLTLQMLQSRVPFWQCNTVLNRTVCFSGSCRGSIRIWDWSDGPARQVLFLLSGQRASTQERQACQDLPRGGPLSRRTGGRVLHDGQHWQPQNRSLWWWDRRSAGLQVCEVDDNKTGRCGTLNVKKKKNQPSEVCAKHLTCLYMFYFQKLAAIPPSAFYHKEHKHLGENYVRFCFIKVSDLLCLNNTLLSLLIHIQVNIGISNLGGP